MLRYSILSLLVALPIAAQQPVKPAPAEAVTKGVAAEQAPTPESRNPLGFTSQKFEFKWDSLIPLGFEIDGLKVNSIFFNTRDLKARWLKDSTFGTRAQVEVTNAAKSHRIPGFAVAVFDQDGRLLGVASGGTKVGVIKPGTTETFDLNFTPVKERLPRGDHFVLSVELR
jgi:hypothetical protein